MLILNNITLNIAGNILIKDSSVNIPTNSKIGFLGKNGSGKSSLFRAISGDIELQTGDIKFAKHATIGWVKQEVATGQESLLDILLSSDKERSSLLDELGNSVDATRIAEICEKLEEIDAYSAPARAQAILNGLGFSEEEHHGPIENFSGGMRMRVALAASLFSRPDILLLDEPSNYLDLEGVMWLEQYIKKFTGTIILISHDKNLLNNCANHILHLEHQKLTLWKGNYNSYLKLYAEKLNISQQQLKAQTEKIQRLERFIERFRYKASKARQAQSRVKTLEKIKQIEIYSPERTQAFSFLAREKTLASPLVKIENIFLGYDNKYILKNLNLPINNDDRIALLGKNGNGKSTFAKFLAQRLEPLKGEKVQHPKISIGYFEQHNIKALNLDLNAIEHIALIFPNLPEAKQRAMAANWGLSGEKALIKTRNLSGGQKTRLAMGLATAKEIDLLILDEPTNHLDLESREELIRALNNYNGAVLLISHDQYLLEATIDCLWHVENNTIAVFEGTLEDYKQNILQPKSAKKKVKKVGSIDLKKDINKIETKLAKLHKDLAELNEILWLFAF